jgi:hypothetical protein
MSDSLKGIGYAEGAFCLSGGALSHWEWHV